METLKLNTPYFTTLTTRTLQTFFRNLTTDTFDCVESRYVMYGGGGLSLKLKTEVCIILLKKVDKGHIAYLTNYIYGVGEFIFITDKELIKISNLELVVKDKKYIVGQWRHFWFKDDVIKEFVHPLKEQEKELNQIKQNAISTAESLLRAESDLKKLNKRF